MKLGGTATERKRVSRIVGGSPAHAVRIAVPHRLDDADALRRIIERCREAEASGAVRFLPGETIWRSDGCIFAAKALGQTFHGELTVGSRRAEMRLSVGGPLGLFANRIAGVLEAECKRILKEPSATTPASPPRPRRPPTPPGDGAADAVIGVVSGYGWEECRIWATSLAECGFAGARVVIAVDPAPDLVRKLENLGFEVAVPSGSHRLSTNGRPVPFLVERFSLAARFLESAAYRFVVLTDVRDVVFQSNPSTWLEANIGEQRILASSEGVRIGDEWWGSYMLEVNFGTAALERLGAQPSCNAGIIAGRCADVRRLASDVVRLCATDKIIGADQAAFNLVLRDPDWAGIVATATQEQSWACQAGTVADGRQGLSGFLLDSAPVLNETCVETARGEPYAIVHQYDRVPEWRTVFEALYSEPEAAAATGGER